MYFAAHFSVNLDHVLALRVGRSYFRLIYAGLVTRPPLRQAPS
eukprot:SAG31_NODE_10679_length_1110_cov_22.966370_1_plen_42_part_10